MATPTAIAAGGAAARDVFLTPERNGAIATVAGFEKDFCFVEDFIDQV